MNTGETINDAMRCVRHGRDVRAKRLPPRCAAGLSVFEHEASLAVGQLAFRQHEYVRASVCGTPVALDIVVDRDDVAWVAGQHIAVARANSIAARDEAVRYVSRAVCPSRHTSAAAGAAPEYASAEETLADDCPATRYTDDAAVCAVAIHRAGDADTALAALDGSVLRVAGNAAGILCRGRYGACRGEVVDVPR